MEAAVYVARTLDIIEALKRDYDNVGVCIQSYLYRSRDDLDRLKQWAKRAVSAPTVDDILA
jgi:proline dehydrogenase